MKHVRIGIVQYGHKLGRPRYKLSVAMEFDRRTRGATQEYVAECLEEDAADLRQDGYEIKSKDQYVVLLTHIEEE